MKNKFDNKKEQALSNAELSNMIGGTWWVDTALIAVGYAIGYLAKESYAENVSCQCDSTIWAHN